MSTTPFINDHFLLPDKKGFDLYHGIASGLPIIDYHCHLSPKELAEDRQFKNLYGIWLAGDHYKWRAMRTAGVDEELITGRASDKEKFLAWARTVPKTLRNPLFHWSQMELKDPFGIDDLLTEESAESIWGRCNEMLQTDDFSAQSLVRRNHVRLVATTDDPVDSLDWHKQLKGQPSAGFRMVPTYRPDRGMEIENRDEFKSWINRLEKASNLSISSFGDLLEALRKRHDDFHELGCRASDHGVYRPHSASFTESAVSQIFDAAMSGKEVSARDVERYKSAFLYHCGVMDHEKGWAFQLHMGAQRNNNSRMYRKIGRDSGFDSMGDPPIAQPLATLLNRLDKQDQLPRVILYNINPRDNELFVTMAGNFQDGRVPGKVQHGPPWWFMDQRDGIERQLESLSNMGLLSQFIGMTTDSRSLLSWSRHDYFRRTLCHLLGRDLANGMLPDEPSLIDPLIRDVCYHNAEAYFRFEGLEPQ